MKNKKVLYGLIIGVVAIWGTIGYKVLISIGGNDTVVYNNSPIKIIPKLNLSIDTFKLKNSYKDPFLRKITTEKSIAVKSKSQQQITQRSKIDREKKKAENFAKCCPCGFRGGWCCDRRGGIIRNECIQELNTEAA